MLMLASEDATAESYSLLKRLGGGQLMHYNECSLRKICKFILPSRKKKRTGEQHIQEGLKEEGGHMQEAGLVRTQLSVCMTEYEYEFVEKECA